MAEDMAELALEAVDPMLNRREVDNSLITLVISLPFTQQYSGVAKSKEQGQVWTRCPSEPREPPAQIRK